MILVGGLGNPGSEYTKTRHNVGFMAVDHLVNRHNFFYEQKKKFNVTLAQGVVNEIKLLLAKPQTYMNLSGQPIASLASYYKVNLNNIFILHDDVDLDIGRIKIKIGGSSAGHNGLKSIDSHLGSNYYRIRIGVGKPTFGDLANYVLGKFTNQEYIKIMNSINKIVDNLPLLLNHEIEQFKSIIGVK